MMFRFNEFVNVFLRLAILVQRRLVTDTDAGP